MDNEIKALLEEILTAVKGIDRKLTGSEAVTPSSGGGALVHKQPQGKALSVKEFIIDRAPGNGVQMTLTIAHFLEAYEGLSPFNSADLEKAFRTAREPIPSNINDKANMCVKNGFFMEEKEKKDSLKAWVVTRTGEETVRAGFGKKRN